MSGFGARLKRVQGSRFRFEALADHLKVQAHHGVYEIWDRTCCWSDYKGAPSEKATLDS